MFIINHYFFNVIEIFFKTKNRSTQSKDNFPLLEGNDDFFLSMTWSAYCCLS